MNALARVKDEVAGHMDQILALWKPARKITVIVRSPGVPDQDFMMTNDEMPEVRELIRRRELGEVDLDCHKLDNPRQVFFYEQDFYVLSNFSAFSLVWGGYRFDTSEHAYHWEKFRLDDTIGGQERDIQRRIRIAPSAHDAFKFAELNREFSRPDWDQIKVDVMRHILWSKVEQHEYVRRKLLATGDRQLIEDSWRDDFWGWGQNRDGQNMLGKLWMEIREELRGNGAAA